MLSRGFTSLEMLASIGIIAAALLLMVELSGLRHSLLVRANAKTFARTYEQYKSQASASRGSQIKLVFRPEIGPFREIHASVDGQKMAPQKFPKGFYLVDVHSLLRRGAQGRAELVIDQEGQPLNEKGKPMARELPFTLLMASDRSERVAYLEITEKGRVVVR